MKKSAIIVGGGAAGMFVSVQLAKNGFSVTLLEKNEKLGKKIFITGKGRCNFTNACTRDIFFSSVMRNPRFLYSAYAAFDPDDAIRFFEDAGMPVKVERGQRAFPVSDHAYDVTDALKRQMKRYGVTVRLHTEVSSLITETVEPPNNGGPSVRVCGVRTREPDGTEGIYEADRVVIATGGLSYPTTGSTGDGYSLAASCGHTVADCHPSLVPLLVGEEEAHEMEGLSLRNVTLTIFDGKKKVFSEFGEMLFTGDGISGPLVLTASSVLAPRMSGPEGAQLKEPVRAEIDLKPAISRDELEARFIKLFSESPNRDLANAVKSVYPSSLILPFLRLAGLDGHKKAASVTKEERRRIVEYTKALPLTVTGNAGFKHAVITQGGVSVKEVDPKTMASKKAEGLYFAGEVLDLDAKTGGFNLQIAWSTAYAAGNA